MQRQLLRWGFHVGTDGYFGPGTLQAVKAFQRKHGERDDGVVGPKTWSLLENPNATNIGSGVDTATPPHTPVATSGGGGTYFPLSRVYSESWTKNPGSFGSGRGGGRKHAGCDLYAPLGTWIHAVRNGKVIRGPYYFYCDTYALEVDHGDFVIRYGEIQSKTTVREGDKVQAGQRIARVGHLVGIRVPSDMLHLEMYSGQASGGLTVRSNPPYQRRSDLINPTPYLAQWRQNMPTE